MPLFEALNRAEGLHSELLQRLFREVGGRQKNKRAWLLKL